MVDLPKKDQEKPKAQGSNILPKLLLLIAAIVLVIFVVNGFEFSFSSLINSILTVGVVVFLLYLAYLGIQSLREEKPFSPTRSLINKYIRIAEICKPENVKELFLRGDDMRLFSKLGKITGLLFIPYLASVPELDSEGKPILIDKRNKFGAIEKDDYGKPIKVQKMKMIPEKDGDWLIVMQKGLFKEKILIRAHHSLVSSPATKMWINDVNVVPFGEFYYPSKQWQEFIHKVTAQHMTETILETLTHYWDLISNISEATLNSNPDYLRISMLNNEVLSNRGGIVGGNP